MQLDDLIVAVRTERKQAASGGGTGGNSWPYLFKAFFVDDNNHADDLLFFVANLEHGVQADPAALLQVYRRGSETRPMPPITGREFDWEESTCLNLLMQQVSYELTSAICKRDPITRKLSPVSKKTISVYPSPSKRSMEVKESDEQITYPMLYFSIDNFDELFEGMVIAPGHDACVELVACCSEIRTTIFSGAVTHGQLMASYKSRKSGRRFRSQKSNRERNLEFLNMRGPRGVGHAEMAVSQVEDDDAGAASGGFSGFFRRLSFSDNRATDTREITLNAFLTYVSLSWKTVIEAVIENPQRPALSKTTVQTART